MIREEKHSLQMGRGIRFFYTFSLNGTFATATCSLVKADFKLTETEQNVLAELACLRKHRRCVSSQKVVIRIFRKDLPNVLEVFRKILNGHITEENLLQNVGESVLRP